MRLIHGTRAKSELQKSKISLLPGGDQQGGTAAGGGSGEATVKHGNPSMGKLAVPASSFLSSVTVPPAPCTRTGPRESPGRTFPN